MKSERLKIGIESFLRPLVMALALCLMGVLPWAGPSGAKAAAIVQMAAGAVHTVVLMDDGTVRTWGHNLYGELG